MHERMRLRVAQYPTGLHLMRIPMDEGALVLAFRHSHPHPEWVAKRASGERSRERLRVEKQVLEQLQPWQAQLRVPALLDWDDDGEECCLLQTGVAGQIDALTLPAAGRLPPRFRIAAQWLESFQNLAQPLVSIHLRELTRQWLDEVAAAPDSFSAPLWEQVRILTAPALPAMPVHGDFWDGNLLFDGNRLSVVDWSGFGSGTPLQDLLTLLFRAPVTRRGRLLASWDAFVYTFFTPSPARALLVDWAARRGLGVEGARFCFYLFLAHRLRWELGFCLQQRSEEEQSSSHHFWQPILSWLADRHYPDPFLDAG